jgi:hypothetical protein
VLWAEAQELVPKVGCHLEKVDGVVLLVDEERC